MKVELNTYCASGSEREKNVTMLFWVNSLKKGPVKNDFILDLAKISGFLSESLITILGFPAENLGASGSWDPVSVEP